MRVARLGGLGLLGVTLAVLLAGAATAQVQPNETRNDRPHLDMRFGNRGEEEQEFQIDVEGPFKRETTIQVPPGENRTIRLPAPHGAYEVAIEDQSTQRDVVDPTPTSFPVYPVTFNNTGCPGTWLVNYTFSGSVPVPEDNGCLAEPPSFTDLLERARQAAASDPTEHIAIPAPGNADAGRYRVWRNLLTPNATPGGNLTFSFTPNVSFADAWGRPVEGSKLVWDRENPDIGGPFTSEAPNRAYYRPAANQPLAYTEFFSFVGVATPEGTDETLTYLQQWDDTPGEPACVLRSPVQDRALTLDEDPIRAQVCQAGPWTPGEDTTLRGFDAYPLYNVETDGERVTVHRLVLADSITYPLAYERFAAGGAETADHVAYRLTHLNQTPSPPRPTPDEPSARTGSVPTGPVHELDGPQLGADTDRFPLTLAEASQAARTDPRLTDLQSLLENSQAVLSGAKLGRLEAGHQEADRLGWWLVYTAPDGGEVTVLCQRPAPANRTVETPLSRPDAPAAECDEDADRPIFAGEANPPEPVGPDAIPETAATFGAALERWAMLDPDAHEEPVVSAIYRPWTTETRPDPQLGVGRSLETATSAVVSSSRSGSGAIVDLETGRTLTQQFSQRETFGLVGEPAPLATSDANAPDGSDEVPVLVGSAAGLGLLGLLAYVATSGGLSGLYARITGRETLEHLTRQAIVNLLDETPGLHENAIGRRVDANERTVEHHLDMLVREDVLATLERGGYKHYFVNGRHAPREMQALATLRRGRAEEIYELVRNRPGIGVSELAEAADVSKPYASKLVNRLVDAGLVDKVREGRSVELFVNDADLARED
jgi:DNA-binding transcriptional ArsR family regulator